MKFTLSWLKDHLATEADLGAISDTLTAIGLEVEGVEDPSAALKGMVVAEIISADKHPDADRLKVCQVSTGSETHTVVCGAPNARVGLKGILAKPGDVIPASGDKLKIGKIRGVESHGMMCSARELNLGDDHDGIIDLPVHVQAGDAAAEALQLEPVIDIALTPNRVDALGVRGVARDLAAAGIGTLKPFDVSPVAGTFPCGIQVTSGLSEDQEHLCPHFVGRVVRGVRNRESPEWLQARLRAIGLRPVSALVDITQYINIDLGRPLHAFDLSKIGSQIGPRLARRGEKMLALNGTEYELDDSMVVIADEHGALAIAGIMGGENSSCTEDTTDIFLESALFDPINIARTGRALGIVSDARYRFERGVDPASTAVGAEVAARMIVEICGGEVSDLAVSGDQPSMVRTVSFRPERVSQLGGIEVSPVEASQILARLGFGIDNQKTPWIVDVPSWRRDVDGEHDLVEDVLRIKGYDSIPTLSLPRIASTRPAFSIEQRRARSVRRSLASRGLFETTTWSFMAHSQAALFVSASNIHSLENPLSAELDVLRPSLLPNLIAAVGRNAVRAMPNVSLFEIGPRFEGDAPGEQTLIAGGVRAGDAISRHWTESRRDVDVLDAKADALAALAAAGVQIERVQIGRSDKAAAPSWYHPGQSGTICLGPNVLAEFGAVHPNVLKQMDVNGPLVGFEVFLDRVPIPKKSGGPARPKFTPSHYQPVERDFAFVVADSVGADDVLRAIRGVDKDLITAITLFDVYTGDNVDAGNKSLALSVRFEPRDATLTDTDIESLSQRIISAVEKAVGGQLRV